MSSTPVTRHRDEFTDIFDQGRIFFEVKLVDQMFGGTVSPFIELLREQNLNMTAAEVGQLGGHSARFCGLGAF
jgi:hypothetical protein